jgi:hypothetical protein
MTKREKIINIIMNRLIAGLLFGILCCGGINVPALESRTDVEPVNKIQSGQGHLLGNETPKEFLPP